jgi:hypothetical protein
MRPLLVGPMLPVRGAVDRGAFATLAARVDGVLGDSHNVLRLAEGSDHEAAEPERRRRFLGGNELAGAAVQVRVELVADRDGQREARIRSSRVDVNLRGVRRGNQGRRRRLGRRRDSGARWRPGRSRSRGLARASGEREK